MNTTLQALQRRLTALGSSFRSVVRTVIRALKPCPPSTKLSTSSCATRRGEGYPDAHRPPTGVDDDELAGFYCSAG
jgi:hypothetical protein